MIYFGKVMQSFHDGEIDSLILLMNNKAKWDGFNRISVANYFSGLQDTDMAMKPGDRHLGGFSYIEKTREIDGVHKPLIGVCAYVYEVDRDLNEVLIPEYVSMVIEKYVNHFKHPGMKTAVLLRDDTYYPDLELVNNILEPYPDINLYSSKKWISNE